MKLPLLLGAKAEIVFGTLLVMRNRAVRLSCALALTAGALLSVQEVERFPGAQEPRMTFLIVGTLAAVAGSRLLAPGGALAASRQVATVWWLVPLGRLTGALLVVLPVAAVPAFATVRVDVNPMLYGISVFVLAAAVASFSSSLAPMVGSSAGVTVAIAAVWIGALPTDTVHAWAERWPAVQQALAVLWNTLPLPWRADRILIARSSSDAVVLVGWIAFGFVVAGWASTAAWPRSRRNGGRE